MQAGIFLKNVTKIFPSSKTTALDAIDADISLGKRIGIVGPDGAGKTTLLRILSGLLKPSSGVVSVMGFDTVKNAGEIHKILGYMPQKFGLYEDLTVLENLQLYGRLQGIDRDKRGEIFAKLLAFSSLEPFQNRLAGKLSGGMKQKLGLCSALMKKPRILILDEPTVGVDPLSRRELWKMVCDLWQEDTTIFWSTSYLDEAQLCDEVLLLYEGKIVYYGAPQEFTDSVKDRVFLLQGIGNMVDKKALFFELYPQKAVVDVTVESDALRLVLDKDEKPIITRGNLVAIKPRFEDAFMDFLKKSHTYPEPISCSKKLGQDEGVVIEAKGLNKQFGNFKAVDNVSFQVRKGEIFGFLGPNGAGKSTTFKMLCGLLQPDSGNAFVSGVSLQKASSEARGKVGYMAQKFSLYDNMIVEQNLKFFSGIYGLVGRQRERAIAKMLEIFSLHPYVSMPAKDLPLGYKQRLALACALMHEPDVLFLDEPTAGVDPLTRREFWSHINSLVQGGMTVMITTHFMDEAEYCDRIALILDGRVMNLGTPQELKHLAKASTLQDAFITLSSQRERCR